MKPGRKRKQPQGLSFIFAKKSLPELSLPSPNALNEDQKIKGGKHEKSEKSEKSKSEFELPSFLSLEQRAKELKVKIPESLGRHLAQVHRFLIGVEEAKKNLTWDWPNTSYIPYSDLTPTTTAPGVMVQFENPVQFFEDHGWVVFRKVADAKLVAKCLQGFSEGLRKEAPQVVDQPVWEHAEWSIKNPVGRGFKGLVYTDWMNEARLATLPFWEKLWGTKDLLTSFDAGRYIAPGQMDKKTAEALWAEANSAFEVRANLKRQFLKVLGDRAEAKAREKNQTQLETQTQNSSLPSVLPRSQSHSSSCPGKTEKEDAGREEYVLDWLHADRGPGIPAFQNAVQGMLLLTDSWEENGGLVVLDQSHKIHKEYLETYPEQGHNGTIKFSLALAKKLYPSLKPLKICAEAGDLVVWDSRTFHFGVPGKMIHPKTHDILGGRFCVYISMHPRHFASQVDLEERVKAFEHGVEGYGHVCIGHNWSPPSASESALTGKKRQAPTCPALRGIVGYPLTTS